MRHLSGLGYEVSSVDTGTGVGEEALADADLVAVSVPIDATAAVVSEVARRMKPGATLMEIASLKEGVVTAMIGASGIGLNPLCVHPMFGPSTETLDNKTVAVIPVADAALEASEAARLFPGADLVALDAESHDRCMAAVLSLPYLLNLAYAKAIAGEDLPLLRRLGGSTFSVQYALTQSLVAEQSELVESLLKGNRYLDELAGGFDEALNTLMGSMRDGGFTEVHAGLLDAFMSDLSFAGADERRRRMFDAVK